MKHRLALVCLYIILCTLFCKSNTITKAGAGIEQKDTTEKARRQDVAAFNTPEFSLLLVLPYSF